MKKDIQIYVLSRDRPDFLKECLFSVLAQDVTNFELIVSDNSQGNSVMNMMNLHYPNVKIIRRIPQLGALDHFRCIIEEANSKYVVLFHDDDILCPQYVQKMQSLLDENRSAVGVGCNAEIFRENTREVITFSSIKSKVVELTTKEELVRYYFELPPTNPVPFPCYMYRTSAIKGASLDYKHGGKHSDVSFLLKVMDNGSLLWTSEILMKYRRHSGNDSSKENIYNRLSLLRYVYKNTSIQSKSELVKKYKFKYWSGWLFDHMAVPGLDSRRKSVVIKFILINGICYAAKNPSFLNYFFKRLAVKVKDFCRV